MTKSTFNETIWIKAPIQDVWKILADIGTIADWNPGLSASHATSKIHGPGATRHCVLKNRHSLDEEVVHFEPDNAITFRILQSTLPFQSADIRFRLSRSNDQTIVSVSPIYQLKFGILGRFLDTLLVSNAYRRGMRGLLSGLKERAENNQQAPNRERSI